MMAKSQYELELELDDVLDELDNMLQEFDREESRALQKQKPNRSRYSQYADSIDMLNVSESLEGIGYGNASATSPISSGLFEPVHASAAKQQEKSTCFTHNRPAHPIPTGYTKHFMPGKKANGWLDGAVICTQQEVTTREKNRPTTAVPSQRSEVPVSKSSKRSIFREAGRSVLEPSFEGLEFK